MNKNNNIFLCSFASPDLYVSRLRFERQIKKFNFYQSYKIFSFNEIPIEGQNFIKMCKKNNDLRGFGYWIWKPYIIQKYLETLPADAILHYCDIGCVFNNSLQVDKNIINDLADKCIINNMVAFNYSKPNKLDPELSCRILYEYQFTKKELFNFYGISNKSKYYNSAQYSAGSFFIKKSSFSFDFINKWKEPFLKNKKLVDNSKSDIEEHHQFIEHRHDQSVFSLLCKLNNIFTLSVYDYFEHSYFKNIPYWENIISSPLHHKRDLRYISKKKFINYLKNIFLK